VKRAPEDLGGLIMAEGMQRCSVCGELRETRPYGKDDAEICWPCGMQPENKPYVDAAMERRFGGLRVRRGGGL
jgi:hypothetical protein